MDIKEKLALLKKEVEQINKKHEAKKTVRRKPAADISLPGFIEDENKEGRVYFRETSYPMSHRHGCACLREVLETPGEVFEFLGNSEIFREMQIEKTVFIDTETTGLAGGTGTVAFMIGAGFIKNDSFIVRQYFMPDYSYEAAMLGHLNDLMREFDGGLVSFNGRAFDLPLITTRMTMNRIRSSCSDAIHLDLIYPARRFWKKTILSCSLSSLEKNVLGIEREDDVPGFLIPAMYFQYLRDRNFDRMEGIFLHNLKDIVSLASLIVRMWEHIELAETDALKGTEYFSMGKIYEVKGDLKKAAEFHEKACACCHDAEDLRKIRQSFAALLKKMKNWDRVTSLWEEIACESRFDISAHIELAKFHEHQTKDYAKALEYAEEALEKIYKKRSLGRDSLSFYKEQDEVLKRMLRLKRKTGEK